VFCLGFVVRLSVPVQIIDWKDWKEMIGTLNPAHCSITTNHNFTSGGTSSPTDTAMHGGARAKPAAQKHHSISATKHIKVHHIA